MALKDYIVKATDPMTIMNAMLVIYGEPGVGKTTIAQTALRPFTFLFDPEGALRAGLRDDLLQVVALQETAERIRKSGGSKVISWRELKRELNAATDFAEYDTVIIDTAGEAVETLKTFAVDDNVKNKGSFDGLSGQGWGVVSSEYSWLMNQAFAGGCDIVVLGQMREDRGRGDATVERLDMAGRARQIVMSKATQIGWYGAQGNRRQLRFAPEEGRYTKDSVGLGNVYVPEIDVGVNDDFLARTLDVIKGRINKRNEGSPSTPTTEPESKTAAAVATPGANQADGQPAAASSAAAADTSQTAASTTEAAADDQDDPFESDSTAAEPEPEPDPEDGPTQAQMDRWTEQVQGFIDSKASKATRVAFAQMLRQNGAIWDKDLKRVVRLGDSAE